MADRDGFGNGAERLDEDLDRSSRMAAEFQAELDRLRQSMAYTSREVGTLSSGIERGLRRAFDGLLLDGEQLSDGLKTVGRSISDTIYALAMRPVEKALAGAVGGLVGGRAGASEAPGDSGGLGGAVMSGVTGLLAGMTPFAKGGGFVQGRVMPFAKGGVVSAPTAFPMRGATGLMGEAGPEAIMPLRRGADGRLGVAGPSGVGGRQVNVTINVQTPDVAGFQRSQSQIAAQIGRALARGDRNS